MKASNLKGEYCQNCASILDDVQRNHRRVIVLDSQCAAVFSQSGDSSRLDDLAKTEKPANPEKFPSHAPHHEAKAAPEAPKPPKAKEPEKPAKRSKR